MLRNNFSTPLAVLLVILLGTSTAEAARFTPILWLDANDLDGDKVAEGSGESGFSGAFDQVDRWVNKAGGPDATSNGGFRPLYLTGHLNSLPVVRFPQNKGRFMTVGDLKLAPTDYTAFFVVSPLTQSNNNEFLLDTNDPNGIRSTIAWQIFGNNQPGYYSGNKTYHTTDETNLAAPQVLAFNMSSPDGSSIVRNGTPLTLANDEYVQTTLSGLGFPRNVSNTANFDGDYAEMIIFDRSLSGTQLANVTAYLGDKWGIATTGGSAYRGFQLVSGLPEPSSWLSLLGALVTVGLGHRLRQRRSAPAA